MRIKRRNCRNNFNLLTLSYSALGIGEWNTFMWSLRIARPLGNAQKQKKSLVKFTRDNPPKPKRKITKCKQKYTISTKKSKQKKPYTYMRVGQRKNKNKKIQSVTQKYNPNNLYTKQPEKLNNNRRVKRKGGLAVFTALSVRGHR